MPLSWSLQSVVARNNDILKKLVLEAKREYEKDAEHRVHIFLADTYVLILHALGAYLFMVVQYLWVLAMERRSPKAADELNCPSARCKGHAPRRLQRLPVLGGVVSSPRSFA
jgi:hypothetical protein